MMLEGVFQISSLLAIDSVPVFRLLLLVGKLSDALSRLTQSSPVY